MSGASPNLHDAAPAQRRGWPIIVALVLAELLAGFESSMIYSALAKFYRTFHDPIAIGWLVTGYMLVASIAAAICGRLGDMYGRRRVLLVVMACAGLGSIFSAMSSQLEWIIVGRSIQGLAGSILPLCYGIVREHCSPKRIGVNIGIISATASGGAGVGMVVGGLLVDNGSWRLIFISSAALAVVAIIAVRLFVPRGKTQTGGSLDWIGALLFIVGMGLLLYALGLGEEHGWGSLQQLLPVAIAIVLLGFWTIHELRVTSPLIDVRLIANRQIGVALLVFALVSLGSLNVAQVIMVMLQQPVETGVGLGISATIAGALHTPGSILGVIASPLIGWIAGRHGGRSGMIAATAIMSVAWCGLVVAHHNVPLVTGWMLLNGFGIGALMAAVPNLIVEVAPPDRTSESTGVAQIVRKISMACGAQLVAISLASSTIAVGKGAYPDGAAYSLTYGWVATLNIAALLLSFLLPRRRATANATLGQPVHSH